MKPLHLIQAVIQEGRWKMPYRFSSAATRDKFLERLRAENPGREFKALDLERGRK